MIYQKEFYQTKHYYGVVILDIFLSKLWNCSDCVELSGYLYYKNCKMTNDHIAHFFQAIQNAAFANDI